MGFMVEGFVGIGMLLWVVVVLLGTGVEEW